MKLKLESQFILLVSKIRYDSLKLIISKSFPLPFMSISKEIQSDLGFNLIFTTVTIIFNKITMPVRSSNTDTKGSVKKIDSPSKPL